MYLIVLTVCGREHLYNDDDDTVVSVGGICV